MLKFSDIQDAQSVKGFDLVQQAQLATVGSPYTSFNTLGQKIYTPPDPTLPVPGQQIVLGAGLSFGTGGVTEDGSSAVNGAIAGINQANPPPVEGSSTPSLDMATTGDFSQDSGYQAAQGALDTSQSQLQTAQNALPSQAGLLTQAQQATGATANLAEVQNLKTQLASATASYQNEFARTETKGISEGTPALYYQGILAAKQRQAAIVTTGLAARLSAAQSNWAQAEQLAEKTAELQWADAQQKVNNIKDFIALNQDNLTRAEKVAVSKMQTQAKKLQDQIDTYKGNMQLALKAGLTTKYTNNAGEIFRTSDGKSFENEQQFFADSGVTSWDEAYTKGLIGNYSPNTEVERGLLADMISKYPDSGVTMTDTFKIAQSKLQNSRIYQDQVRGPVGSGGGSGGSGGGVLGLNNQQIDNISPLVTQFQNSPIVKNYNMIGEAYNFVNNLSDSTTNPADDQALIYAFAKAQDPDSVVREGEYATVQKYSQSWVKAYGKSVENAITGTGFLSVEARKNMKATIKSRFKTAETSYTNIYKETERRVNLVGNTDKGNQLLNNYGGAFTPQGSTPAGFVGPVMSKPEEIVTTPETKGWWDKTTNWLWGAD